MKQYVCDACGWVYDEAAGAPDLGIAPGTKFEDLPEYFACPLCGVGTDMFSEALFAAYRHPAGCRYRIFRRYIV